MAHARLHVRAVCNHSGGLIVKLTRNQQTRAKQIGLNRALDRATDSDYQRKMRELRAENIRRANAAS
jgi:hypothetical protein